MMWEKKKLNDCCLSIADGDHQPPPKAESGVPFVTIANIVDNKFDFSNTMFATESYYASLDSKRKAQVGDVLYSVVGSFGIPVLITDEQRFVFQRHIAILRCNKKILLPEYLYYTMLTRDFYMMADTVALGAAQRTISLTALRNMEIPVPPLEIQEKIVEKALPYDALIENNKKQIKLLEEAAQRLYKEWFVDMRFPGYENTPIVNGVPDGWKKQKLIELADVQYGFAFDGTLFNSDGMGTPIIRIRNIPSGTTGDFTTEDAPTQYRVYNGDILVGMDGEFHINSWCGDEAYLVQRTCRFKPVDEKMKGWLLYAIYEPIKFFEKTVVGATVAHLGKKHIDSIELLTGPKQLYEPFQLYFEKRQILLNQNKRLAEARNRLLPKLMNGEIEI